MVHVTGGGNGQRGGKNGGEAKDDVSLIIGTGRSGKELGRYCGCWGIRGREGRRTDVGKLQCLQEGHMALMWESRTAIWFLNLQFLPTPACRSTGRSTNPFHQSTGRSTGCPTES